MLYGSWPGRFGYLAGDHSRATSLVLMAIARKGNVASRSVVWVVELDRSVAGVIAAFPARQRHLRHLRLLLLALRGRAPYDWPPLIRHYRMALRRSTELPARTLYVDALATSEPSRDQAVAASLVEAAATQARSLRLDGLAVYAHKDNAHDRALYESVGFCALGKANSDGLLLLYRPLKASRYGEVGADRP